jgi:hypothetical protein
MPFGELKHGTPGIIQYYQELFNPSNIYTLTLILHKLTKTREVATMRCPCGENRLFNQCHGKLYCGEIKKKK